MEGPHGSLGPLQRLVETWATGARDAEIERVIQVLKDVLRGRGRRDIQCEGGKRYVEIPQQNRVPSPPQTVMSHKECAQLGHPTHHPLSIDVLVGVVCPCTPEFVIR